jgi:6-phosphogluconate dehydrogenase
MGIADIGLIGLAVMGQNIALNIESKGYSIAVFNRTAETTKKFIEGPARGRKRIIPAYSLKDFFDSLVKPRKILIMVKAGAPVDMVIKAILPFLEKGDIVIDGGNSYYKDTVRRSSELKERGVLFLGIGISGGEEGALKGPSIMPGGPFEAWEIVEKIFTDISAKVDGGIPCCSYIGPDGSGHFVKMVHNGIEYADMQLISETYFLMKNLLNMNAEDIGEVYEEWNKGELNSYLVEITAKIMKKIDNETGKPLIDLILDKASQKGTGKWMSMEALDLDIPVPTINESVFARLMSSKKEERREASRLLIGPRQCFRRNISLEDIRNALYASKICAYAQGFDLLSKASEVFQWNLDLGNIALLWRGGCIIRAQFLNKIKEAYDKNKRLNNLLTDSYFRTVMADVQSGWRRVICAAVENGIGVPGMSSALAYYDSYRTEWLPANLIQAQRDFFGSHTFERIDKEGVFHINWI